MNDCAWYNAWRKTTKKKLHTDAKIDLEDDDIEKMMMTCYFNTSNIVKTRQYKIVETMKKQITQLYLTQNKEALKGYE